MSLVRRPEAAPPDTERPRVWRRLPGRPVLWLVPLLYLAGAFALTWHLWADPASQAQVVPANGVSQDIDLFAWFMRYAANAVSHGHLPGLVTPLVNAPEGLNLMWNTSFLLPATLFAPLTLLIGPQATLTRAAHAGLRGHRDGHLPGAPPLGRQRGRGRAGRGAVRLLPARCASPRSVITTCSSRSCCR